MARGWVALTTESFTVDTRNRWGTEGDSKAAESKSLTVENVHVQKLAFLVGRAGNCGVVLPC